MDAAAEDASRVDVDSEMRAMTPEELLGQDLEAGDEVETLRNRWRPAPPPFTGFYFRDNFMFVLEVFVESVSEIKYSSTESPKWSLTRINMQNSLEK